MTTKNRARSGFGLGVTLALMAACGGGGGGGEGGGGSSLAACAPGQTTACICPDGRELTGSCDPFDGVPCGCESGDSDGGGRDATGQNDRGPSPGDGSVPPVDGLEPLTDAPAAEDTTPLTDQGAPADAGPDGAPPPTGCAFGDPCAPTEICDVLSNTCVAVPEPCNDSTNCEQGERCEDGRCLVQCARDAECAGARACVDNICAEADICAVAEDCDPGRICLDSACTDRCDEQRPCDEPLICNPGTGACVERPECVDDAGCAAGDRCIMDRCVGGCVVDAECPGSRRCVDGRCPEPAECFGPSDCDAERLCLMNTCTPSCGDAQPCPGAQSCDAATGVCDEPAMCAADVDCFEGRRCADGQCGSVCIVDAQCPGARTCDQGECREPAICAGAEDCDPGRLCVNLACADPCNGANPCQGGLLCGPDGICRGLGGCDEDAHCAAPLICVEGACAAPCRADVECPGTRSCDLRSGHCPEPARCFGPADCDAGRLCDANRCARICDAANICPAGEICGPGGGCLQPPPCRTDEDCGAAVCDDGLCVDAECEVSRDCGDVLCVDRICDDPRQPECGVGSPCLLPQVCAALGVCVLPGRCGEDQDCPVGAPHCRLGDGECVACKADLDCAASQICSGGDCLQGGPCAADADCPGTRLCLQGSCEPAGDCAGDAFDALDVAARVLALRVYAELILCDGDTDRYFVDLAANEGLEVVLQHPPGSGDLSLSVSNDVGQLLAARDGPFAAERIAIAPAAAARTFQIDVRGVSGDSVPYSLALDALVEACTPDAFEGLLDNNAPERAVPLQLGRMEATLCAGDEDWYAIEAPAGIDLRLTAVVLGAGPAPLLRLLQPSGQLLAESAGSVGGRAAIDGTYRLRVSGAPVSYALDVAGSAGPTTESVACAQAAPIVLGEPLVLRSHLRLSRFQIACGGGPEDYVATLVLDAPTTISIALLGARFGGAVEVRSDCLAPASGVACFALRDGALQEIALPAGRWSLRVKTDDPENTATLLVNRRQACVADLECGGRRVCAAGICREPCLADEQCDGQQTCDLVTGQCLEVGACVADDDCIAPRVCGPDARCFVPECEENEACPDACVDRRCAASLAGECGPGVACGAGLTCAPVGACVFDGVCDADQDCIGSALACHVRNGRCVGCDDDLDCAPTERCFDFSCSYFGGCAGNADCPGNRTCAGGSCLPVACRGDVLDLQQEIPVLAARTYTGLVLCDDDQDEYRVSVRAGEGLQVQLRHAADNGDLSLAILPDAGGPELGLSNGRDGVETLGLDPAAGARMIRLRIVGSLGHSVTYSLAITRTGQGACGNDGFEGALGNNDAAHAARLGFASPLVTLCPGDQDWFAVDLEPGTRLTVAGTPQGAMGGLRVTVLDPLGLVLGEGAVQGGAMVAIGDVAVAGLHRIQMRSIVAGERLSVRLTVSAAAAPAAAASACAAATLLMPGLPVRLPSRRSVDRLQTACEAFAGEEDVFRFDLAAPSRVSLTLGGIRGDATLALRSTCADVASERSCVNGQPPVLQDVQLPAGTWFVIVETRGELEPSLTLTVRP